MSYSTLYAIYKTKAAEVSEYRNGWGSGPIIWDYLSKEFLGLPGWSFSNDSGLWGLAIDPKVPLGLRACLAITLDYAMVLAKDAKIMAEAIRQGGFVMDKFAPDRVNHFPRIAHDMSETKLDKRAIGFGLNCTSVSDTWGQKKKYWGKPFDCYAYITKEAAP